MSSFARLLTFIAVVAALALPLWALYAAQQQVNAAIELLESRQKVIAPAADDMLRHSFELQRNQTLTQMLTDEFEHQAFASSIFALVSSVAPKGLFFEQMCFDFASGEIKIDALSLDQRAPDAFWQNLTQQPALKHIKLQVSEKSGRILLPFSISASLRRD